MKTITTLLAVGTALTIMPQSTLAKEKFLQGLPNGSSFPKSLGHSGSGFTPFGQMFSGTWSASLCKNKFPGSSMTVGQAFGDPCCTWKQGGKPDFTVTFTADFPAKSTQTCATGGGGGAAPASGGAASNGAASGANSGGNAADQSGGNSGNSSSEKKSEGTTSKKSSKKSDKKSDKKTKKEKKKSGESAEGTSDGEKGEGSKSSKKSGEGGGASQQEAERSYSFGSIDNTNQGGNDGGNLRGRGNSGVKSNGGAADGEDSDDKQTGENTD